MSGTSSRVYSRLELKRKDGSAVKLCFQEPPPERLEEACGLMGKYFLTDEAICKSTGLYKNEEALKEYKTIFGKMLGDSLLHVTICCVDDGTTYGGEIAAVSMMSLDTKSTALSKIFKQFNVQAEEIQLLFKACEYLEEIEKLSQQYETHYHGKGIIVVPGYRGLGIANEIVRLRHVVCQEDNVPMTLAWMTARGSQRAAERNNWKTYIEIDPQEMGMKTGMSFAADVGPFKLMYATKD